MSLKPRYGIYSSKEAYCVLNYNGKVVAWGSNNHGGNTTLVDNDISANIVKIIPSPQGFHAINTEGKVFAWGMGTSNTGYFCPNFDNNKDFVDIVTTAGLSTGNHSSFVGLRSDGTIQTWGYRHHGQVAHQIRDEVNSTYIELYSLLTGFVGLKKDRTCVIWGRYDSYSTTSLFYKQVNIKNNLKNIKKVYTSQDAAAFLTFSGGLIIEGTSTNGDVNSTENGIRGRDGLLGDPAVLTSGVKDVYATKSYFYILKDDGSLHVVGAMKNSSTSAISNDFKIEQYAKLTSGVSFVHVNYDTNKCSCLMDNGSVVSLFLDVNDAKNTDLSANVTKLYYSNAIRTDGSVVAWNGYTTTSVSSQVSSGVVEITVNQGAAAGRKSDGSVVVWPNTSYSNHTRKGSTVSHSSYGVRNYSGTIDASVLNSGIIKVYTNNESFAAVKSDGKVYSWGETSFGGNSTSKQSVLTDISVNYQDINDNFSKYLYFRSHDKCRLNEYIETSTTLSQTSYNSTKYGTSGSLNSKTIFHTNLDTSRYVYMYTDTTGGGILKNNNIPISLLLNNGITKANMDTILAIDLDSNLTVSAPTGFYGSAINTGNIAVELRGRRVQLAKTVFKKNFTHSFFNSTKSSLNFSTKVKKSNFKVLHALSTNQTKTYDVDTDSDITSTKGFYIVMEKNQKAKINFSDSEYFTIEITEQDNNLNNIYYITHVNGEKSLIINETDSDTYVHESYPAGPFKDGDKVVVNFLDLVLDGGVIDARSSTASENYTKNTYTNPTISTTETAYPIFGTTHAGFYGIASNDYLYSWDYNVTNDPQQFWSAKADSLTSNSTTGRLTNIKAIFPGRNFCVALLNNGKVDYTVNNDGTFRGNNNGYTPVALNYSTNIWYNNSGVKQTDLTQVSDIVDVFPLFYDQRHARKWIFPKFVLLRSNGTIAYWGNDDDIRRPKNSNEYTEETLMSDLDKDKYSIRGVFGQQLLDPTHANFSPIIKVVVGIYGFIILRQDGKIAILRRKTAGGDDSYLALSPAWNSSRDSNIQLDMQYTLGGIYNAYAKGTVSQYLGKVIDVGVFGESSTERGSFYILNSKGQFWTITDGRRPGTTSNIDTNAPAPTLATKAVHFGDSTLSDPTKGLYFKKTIKVYTAMSFPSLINVISWMTLFDDFSAMTSYSESERTNENTFIDILDFPIWKRSNRIVKGIQYTDPFIKKYYGPYVLLQNNTLRLINFMITATNYTTNLNYAELDKYDWNHPTYGIHGTNNGYTAGTEEYGDISNVKEVYIYNKTSILLKNSGEVLTWGDTSNLANTYSIKDTLVNGTKIIINEGGAAALLKNDGSVVVWGNTTKGGSLTDTVPVIANGTTGNLTSGVQDIFSSGNGFTAVKSNGIIFWSNTRYTSTAVDNLSWSKKTVGYSGRYSNVASTLPLQHLNLKDCSIYKTTTELESVCADLITAGVKEEYVQSLKEYPKYSTNFLRLYIPTDFYKGTTKDDVRKLLIKALYLLNPEIQTFLVRTKDFAVDNKINGELVNIIKPNHGIINLNEYLNREVDFYVPMVNNGDKAIFKDISSNITYKLVYDGTSSYTISKCDGETALYSSSGTTVTGKTVINGTTFNFKDGVMSGRDSIAQSFNCISTTVGAAAYLSTNGKIITWGNDGFGGFSHDEFDQFKPNFINLEFSEYPIEGYIKIASSKYGFVALKNDGTVTSWGNYGIPGNKTNGLITYNHKPDLVDVKEISASYESVYGALKNDGTLVLWGNSSYAYNIHNKHPLTNIKRIIPNYHSFHAIRNDNSLISFGHQYNSLFDELYGVYGTRNKNVNNFVSHQTKLDNIIEVYSNTKNHIAINSSGIAIFWGNNDHNTALDSSIKAHLNTNVFVNVTSTDTCHALLSSTGFVFALGNNKVYQNSTTGQWHSVKTNLQSDCIRIVSSSKSFQVLKSDNKLIGLHGSGDTNNSIDYNQATSVINKPPSDNIESRYILQNIKDVFSGRYGFCAITTSDEVICWGVKSTSYITDIDTNTIKGGSLSGTEDNEDRPMVVFNNGLAWCCLKENDTVVTWSGTGITKPEWGTDFTHATYGVNSTMWGGNGNGGAVRNGDGSVTTLSNVKNIIPYGDESTYGGFIAVCQDGSGNEYCVQWGGEINDARATQQYPNNSGRSFRHVVEHLTSHSKIRVGIHDNIGDLSWRKSTKENIHEYNYGDGVFTGVETGFGKPLQNTEVIDIDEVTSTIVADLSAAGVDTSIVEEATKEENKLSEDVDEEDVLPDEDSSASNVIQIDQFEGTQLNKQRINFTKLLFAANPSRSKIKVNAGTIGLRKSTYKSKYILFKMNFGRVTIDLANDKNLNANNGFYAPMEPGNTATIVSKNSKFTYEITKSEEKFGDGTYKFFVNFTEGYQPITRFNSSAFIPGSNPQGPFHEDETAFIADTNIEFGSIKETGFNYSFGDPYINPIFGKPTKLPDKMAIYRLLEGKDIFVNGEVNLLSNRKQKLMNDWFINKSGFSPSLFGFVSKGYYYNKFFISSENHTMLCDLEKQIININSDELSYFTIENKYDIFSNALMSGEKCNKYTISWKHKTYGNVLLEILIFENPQIDNAIRIDTEYNINNCIGLLVRNYKPNLMELENIKTEKSKKLRRKLRNRKHKFTSRKLKNKNEVWFDVKHKNIF